MKRPRQSRDPLPPDPLLFAHPLEVPGPEAAGAAVMRELPPELAVRVAQVLRMVHAGVPRRSGEMAVFDHPPVVEWEARLIRGLGPKMQTGGEMEADLEVAVANLARMVASTALVDRREVAWSCIVAMDCAFTSDQRETAIAFAEAAAVVCPDEPETAWVAGKIHRHYGQFREAEFWFRRSARVARWNEDWETYALSWNSLGNLAREQGNYSGARDRLVRALRVARRNGLRRLEGEVLHDMFALSILTKDTEHALRYAEAALQRYGSSHPRISDLAYDAGYYWISQGHFARALPILQMLLADTDDTQPDMQLLAATARAAGACGNSDLFSEMWITLWEEIEQTQQHPKLATILTDLGLGASSLGLWDFAAKALTQSTEIATRRGEGDVLLLNEAALEAVQHQRAADQHPRPLSRGGNRNPADSLALEFVRALQSQDASHQQGEGGADPTAR